jgi:ACS family hexuronate transporter-like MFS transporter
MPVALLIVRATTLDATRGLAAITIIAALAWLINISSLVVDLIPKASLGAVFGVVAAGSTVGGIIMNFLVSSMLETKGAAPSGFINQAVDTLFGPLLRLVQGGGYNLWFTLVPFLYVAAWLLLYLGKIHQPVASSE